MAVSRKSLFVLLFGLLALGDYGSARAQLPTTAAPPPPTLWSFLGIPQGFRASRDAMANRFGKHPGLERVPPLKALADPANLQSKVPAIKAAAEIKQAEDEKKQKIKGIQFLAEVGCGCYDKEKKVSKALLASMDDCTEEVRLAAIEAVGEAAQGESCSRCKQRSCCKPEISKELAKIAWERDESGCWTEPSARVRQAAKEALCICCPGYAPPEETPQEAPGIETPKTAPRVEEGGRPAGAEPTPMSDPAPGLPNPDAEKTEKKPSSVLNNRESDDEDSSSPLATSSRRNASRFVQTSAPALRQTANSAGTDEAGAVVLVDAQNRVARVRLPDSNHKVRVGTRIGVYEPRDGRFVLLGELEVSESAPGSLVARPVGELLLSALSRGAVLSGL